MINIFVIPCKMYRLLTTGTIEEKIFQRQVSKAGLSETVVDSNCFASLKFSMNELKVCLINSCIFLVFKNINKYYKMFRIYLH